jgi:hypothetical protein
MKIITNGHPRDLMSYNDIPANAQEWFDYLSEDEHSEARLVQYRGSWYDVSEFTWTGPNSFWVTSNPELEAGGWDSYHIDTFFSAILVRYVPDSDYEQVVMGLALS